MVMAYKVIVANTFYVEAGSEAEARLRVIGDLVSWFGKYVED